ncbi:HAE1 family efflux transporter outer membrane efflux protein [Corallococcus coralloides]|uniref:HAE1 family efflux transporter outer membrane efflux protein n=1 Tax=Corallococcus coralloides TaxID=184914 RepID=A0A410RQR4_CORCK|nr:TolC family protein [Corallococcus coralloides]QAT84227.1 HAE1 family efflux transporter outer membrane efflux protein [Corallococcus coralloides]
MATPSALLVLLLAAAQQAPSASPAPQQQSTPEAGAAALVPFQPKVDDPMLTPVPPAPEQVKTWDDALTRVRQRSTDLRNAEAGVSRAQGRWRQSLGLLLPNARATAGVGVDVLHPDVPSAAGGGFVGGSNTGTGVAGPSAPLGTLSASLTQSIIDVGAWRGLSSAKASESASVANLQDVQRRLTQGLAQVLVATVAAERAAEINRVGLRQALERQSLTQRSFELGAGTQLDVVRVSQDVAVARQALVAGDEQLRRTRESLGLSLGEDHGVGVNPAFNLGGLVEETRQQCAPLQDLAHRPDLVAQRANVDAARESRRQASAGYLPTLGLSSTLVGFTTDPGFGRFATWNVSAVLSVPLWEGGQREGLVRERKGLEEQTAQSLEATRRDVSVEVSRARRGVEVAEALLKTAAESLELADRTDRLTRRAFEVGRGSSLELVQSGAALRQAQLALVLREFELVQARLDAFLTEARCDW